VKRSSNARLYSKYHDVELLKLERVQSMLIFAQREPARRRKQEEQKKPRQEKLQQETREEAEKDHRVCDEHRHQETECDENSNKDSS
jgi:hypothetical protein